MDEKAEGITKDNIRKLVLDARGRCVEEIIAKQSFSPDEALDIGGRLIAFSSDAALYDEDVTSDLGMGSAAGGWRDIRMEREAALMKASTGDYTGLKGVLQRFGESLPQDVPEIFTNIKVPLKEFNGKFLQMAAVLPDRGKPYTPPLPQNIK